MAFINQQMKQEEKVRIIQELERRGAVKPCPRCGNSQFTLLEGYFYDPLIVHFTSGSYLEGPRIPSVVTGCTQCGFLAQHALGILGLLSPEGGFKQ